MVWTSLIFTFSDSSIDDKRKPLAAENILADAAAISSDDALPSFFIFMIEIDIWLIACEASAYEN